MLKFGWTPQVLNRVCKNGRNFGVGFCTVCRNIARKINLTYHPKKDKMKIPSIETNQYNLFAHQRTGNNKGTTLCNFIIQAFVKPVMIRKTGETVLGIEKIKFERHQKKMSKLSPTAL